DKVDARGEIPVRVAAEAILGERFQRMIGVVAEAEIVDAAYLGVGAGDDDGAFVVEHLPEVAEAGPIGRAFDDEAILLFLHIAFGRDRALAIGDALLDLAAQQAIIFGGFGRAAERGEDRAHVID